MAYVITEPCIGCKDTACLDACPTDSIHPRTDEAGFAEARMLFIDPDTCIDSGACEPMCPVQAIFPDTDVPPQWSHYVEINANWYRR